MLGLQFLFPGFLQDFELKLIDNRFEVRQGLDLAHRLNASGYSVIVSDPQALSSLPKDLHENVQIENDTQNAVKSADAIVIMTPWKEYKDLPANIFGAGATAKVVVDPWRILDSLALDPSVKHIRLGSGTWRHHALKSAD